MAYVDIFNDNNPLDKAATKMILFQVFFNMLFNMFK